MEYLSIKVSLLFAVVLCFSSCGFNKQFYKQEKIPAGFKQETIITKAGDTTFLNIGNNFQPSFTDNRGNQLPLGYTFESIVFKNDKDKNLVGWFIKPKQMPKQAITVLFLHGNGGNILTEFWSALQLVKHGMQVFIFDYSGYGYSEGKPNRERVLNDAVDALKAIRSRADVKDTKVVIYGQSMGAQLAGVAASGNEGLIDGLVMEGSPSSNKDIAAYMFRPFGFVVRIVVRDGYSAFRAIRKYHKPLLVIHSSEDKTAPIFMGRKIYNNANAPKTFYEIKHGHIEGLRYYADSISGRIKVLVGQ